MYTIMYIVLVTTGRCVTTMHNITSTSTTPCKTVFLSSLPQSVVKVKLSSSYYSTVYWATTVYMVGQHACHTNRAQPRSGTSKVVPYACLFSVRHCLFVLLPPHCTGPQHHRLGYVVVQATKAYHQATEQWKRYVK